MTRRDSQTFSVYKVFSSVTQEASDAIESKTFESI